MSKNSRKIENIIIVIVILIAAGMSAVVIKAIFTDSQGFEDVQLLEER